MTSFDTNVLIRIVMEDDPIQGAIAERAFFGAVAQGGAFISTTALVELVWVLRFTFKTTRSDTCQVLRSLIETRGVTVEHAVVVRRALAAFEAGAADFADYLVLEASREAGALPVVTFDERFARERCVELAR